MKDISLIQSNIEKESNIMTNDLLWKADLGNGYYKNPIIFADYSDPDVIRVEDTYYMTASSFNYTPGLPILISKDLVNWELKNYALKNIPYERYNNPAHAKGVWAPAIRYHEGRFWICFGMPDEGIFMVHTDNPLGEWSDPILLLEGKGLIDPCPIWDDDGKAYVVHGYAKSRIGFNSILGIFPISWDGTKAIGEDKFIFDGTSRQKTIEGPKIYKKNGWYYIFAPAGGVRTGWQTVLRSKNIYGPYEEKIVLVQGNTPINGPHQGGLVDTPNKEEWFIHFQDRGLYGRITHLQPVVWKDGWPYIGINQDDHGCGEPVITYKKPDGVRSKEPTYLQASDDFETSDLALQWQWLGNHRKDFYSLTERPGYLRLFSLNPSGDEKVTIWNSSNVLTQKIVCPQFQADVKMDIKGLSFHETAGLVIMGGQYAYLGIKKEESGTSLIYVESEGTDHWRNEKILLEIPVPLSVNVITLRLKLQEEEGKMLVRMSYCLEDGIFKDTGYVFAPSDHTWVGAKLGLFSLALDSNENHGYADFESIKVDALF